MFGRYALPTDDLAGTYAEVSTSGSASLSGSPGSPVITGDEDPEYPAEYIAAMSNTGHLNQASRPAKLLTTSGYWQLRYTTAITVRAAAVIYHNFDAGLPVVIEAGTGGTVGSFSQAFTIPARVEDDWTISPWIEFASAQTYDTWRLTISGTNSLALQVGRLLLVNQLRTLARDVRWGVDEGEEHHYINHPTELNVDTFYDLGGKERDFVGEFAVNNAQTAELQALRRSAHGRIQPWLLIPDTNVNDAWLVRFVEDRFSRVRETPTRDNNANDVHNIVPYRVREVSRGLPWP